MASLFSTKFSARTLSGSLVATAGAISLGLQSFSTVAAENANSAQQVQGLSPVELGKRNAARAAVDKHISSDNSRTLVVGIGSGSTIVYGIERLAERVRSEGLKVTVIPTSWQSSQACSAAGLTISDLNTFPELDLAIDGADEVNRSLDCIKGGGGCHAQEKCVAAAAKKFILIADDRKQSECLGKAWRKGVPVEVLPLAYAPVAKALRELGGTPTLRMATAKAGPVVTDNGNFILDVDFGEINDPNQLAGAIKALPGVLEVGIFPGMAQVAYFGRADGSVEVWSRGQ